LSSVSHQRLDHGDRSLPVEAGPLVTAQARLDERREVVAHDDARGVIEGLRLRVDARDAPADALECGREH